MSDSNGHDEFGALTDEQCMKMYRCGGNCRFMVELSRRYAGTALGVARTYLSNEPLAEDAVQEAFVRVVRRADTFQKDRLFAPWFFRILRNICIDFTRKEKTYAHLLKEYGAEASSTAHSSVENNSGATDLLEHLGAQERQVLKLRIHQEMNFEEIAATCGCTIEAAKKRAQRGLKKLRERLAKRHRTVDGQKFVSPSV